MPVLIYVGRDSAAITREPEHSHEIRGIREICETLWLRLHHLQELYAVVVCPYQSGSGRELSADLVLISQRGLGIMELKDYGGEIDCSRPNGGWRSLKRQDQRMTAESIRTNRFDNPHKQVQEYATQVYEDLQEGDWLPVQPEWNGFKLHTAVCFTRHDANIERCQQAAEEVYREVRKGWERFTVITPRQADTWAVEVRFGINRGPKYGYLACSLTPEAVTRIATDFFGSRRWDKMMAVMPTGDPYAFLRLMAGEECLQISRLIRDENIIGRDPQFANILIPLGYEKVSRCHARISRAVDGVYLEDLDSLNGTYVDGERLTGRVKLRSEQKIALGDHKCQLRFSLHSSAVATTQQADRETVEALIADDGDKETAVEEVTAAPVAPEAADETTPRLNLARQLQRLLKRRG